MPGNSNGEDIKDGFWLNLLSVIFLKISCKVHVPVKSILSQNFKSGKSRQVKYKWTMPSRNLLQMFPTKATYCRIYSTFLSV